jgi:hypothetical protein
MERNALIYALSEQAVVAEARYRVGGTWLGASDAIRRRLTRLYIRSVPSESWFRVLVSLGAIPLRDEETRHPEHLEAAFSRSNTPNPQGSFSLDVVA